MTQVIRVVAPNPGPFTLEGTNTWIVGSDPSVVIDPGPEDEGHIGQVAERAGPIAAILVTHHHPDHAPGAVLLAERSGAPVWAFGPDHEKGSLADDAEIEGGGVSLRALHTPGHSADHFVFFDPEDRALFTGDAVLGWGTSVVDPPDGDLAAYLRSLQRMLDLRPAVIYPGHGPVVEAGEDKLRQYLAHRAERELQVLGGLAGGPMTAEQLVPGIYRDYPAELHPAAARSVLAHLLKLEAEGRVTRDGPEDASPFRLVR